MSCERVRVAISARSDGERVTGESADPVDEHLLSCAGCRAFEQTVRQVRRDLRIAEVGAGIDVVGPVLAALGPRETGHRDEQARPRAEVAAPLAADQPVNAPVRHRRPGPGPQRAAPGSADDTGDTPGPGPGESTMEGASATAGNGRSRPVASHWPSRTMMTLAATLVLVVAAIAFGAGRASSPVVVATDPAPADTGGGPAGSGDDQAQQPSPDDDRSNGQHDQGAGASAADLAVVWTRDRLEPGITDRLRKDHEVMTVVRRATVGLTASWDRGGGPVDQVPDGWSIPIDVIAVDPGSYARLLGAEAIADLAGSEVVLSSTSAELRHLGPGATIELGGVELEVAAVLDDALLGAAEAAVTIETGALLGVDDDRYAIVRLDGPPEELARALDGSPASGLDEEPGEGAGVRVRTAAETDYLRNADAVLPQAEVKRRFGEFAMRPSGDAFEVDPTWFAANIVTADLPLVDTVTCHRAVLDQLEAVLDELEQLGYGEIVTAEGFQGCWNPRYIRATGDLSHHSWGIAVDLTAGGLATPELDEQVSAVFEANGFTWGGNWLVPDDGHYEVVPAAAPR